MTKQPTYMTKEVRAAFACMSCGRVAATALPSATGGPTTFVLARSEDAEYVKRRRCPICLGSLWVGDPETVTTFHKLPDTEVTPRPGRPKKAPSERKTAPCADCGKSRPYRAVDPSLRCRDCSLKAMAAAAATRFRPIAEYLAAAGRPLGSREISEALGITPGEVRGLVTRATKRGAPVVTVGKSYQWLEQAAPAPSPERPRKSAGGDQKNASCIDCGTACRNRRRLDEVRCWDCTFRHRTDLAEARHQDVLDILAKTDRPLGAKAIAARLGRHPEFVRQVITGARRRGVPVVTVGKAYLLHRKDERAS